MAAHSYTRVVESKRDLEGYENLKTKDKSIVDELIGGNSVDHLFNSCNYVDVTNDKIVSNRILINGVKAFLEKYSLNCLFQILQKGELQNRKALENLVQMLFLK